MPRLESDPIISHPPTVEVNPAYSNLRACTGSIFCSGASFAAKNEIAHKAKVGLATVEDQALPQKNPGREQLLNLGNFNFKGTGKAYQELIADGTLDVVNGHADTTIKPF